MLQCNITRTAFRYTMPKFRFSGGRLKYLKTKKKNFQIFQYFFYIKIMCMMYKITICVVTDIN